MNCREININSKKELEPYFDLVDYEGCEYCFTTLFMWQHKYKTSFYIKDDFAVITAKDEEQEFLILPLCKKEKIEEVMNLIIKDFKEKNKKIHFKGVSKEVCEILEKNYKNKFEYIEERDSFDYVYDAEGLRTLSGTTNRKKRNHLNYFLKEYEGRYEYKLLDENNFDECIELVKSWGNLKSENNSYDENMDEELIGIKKIFKNYNELKEKVKVAGIYIDEKLESFTIGELLNDNMVVIHIEKANANIRGLYQFINQQFLVNEFKNVEFVNREDDLGIEGLRKAKLSYHPIKFVEKYSVLEK